MLLSALLLWVAVLPLSLLMTMLLLGLFCPLLLLLAVLLGVFLPFCPCR